MGAAVTAAAVHAVQAVQAVAAAARSGSQQLGAVSPGSGRSGPFSSTPSSTPSLSNSQAVAAAGSSVRYGSLPAEHTGAQLLTGARLVAAVGSASGLPPRHGSGSATAHGSAPSSSWPHPLASSPPSSGLASSPSLGGRLPALARPAPLPEVDLAALANRIRIPEHLDTADLLQVSDGGALCVRTPPWANV